MKYLEGDTFAELYTKAMEQVYCYPDYETAPRGQKIRECLNVVMQVNNPLSNLFKCSKDKSLTLPTRYTKKEICLYLNGTDKLADFCKASSFWDKIKNPDGETVNSAYGNLIFNPSLADGRSQFDWAFDCLKNDKDSRQAFMRFNNTSHQYEGVKDLPCTFVEIFHIRDSKLHATIEMRSNDIVKGLAHDVPSFTLFQYLMYLRLKDVYPELELGTYTHISHSLHIYEEDFELVKSRLDAGIEENSFPMPQSWHVIKSDDIKLVKDERLDGQKVLKLWEMPENSKFYEWILS